MPFLAFPIKEKGRNKLGVLICFLNLMASFVGFILLCYGVVIMIIVSEKSKLVSNSAGYAFSRFVCSIAGSMILFHLCAAKIFFDAGFYRSRRKVQGLVGIFLLFNCILVIGNIAIQIWSIFFAANAFKKSYVDGLESAMKIYSENLNVKLEMDRTQIDYECCGAHHYDQWQDLNWVPVHQLTASERSETIELQKEIEEGKIDREDARYKKRRVPFSCCNPEVLGPCVRQDIDGEHPGRTKGDFTIYGQGCGESMAHYDKGILRAGFWIAQVAMYFGLLVFFFGRYLQTSFDNAYAAGDPKGEGLGYCINQCPLHMCYCLESAPATTIRRVEQDEKTKEYKLKEADEAMQELSSSSSTDEDEKKKKKKKKG